MKPIYGMMNNVQLIFQNNAMCIEIPVQLMSIWKTYYVILSRYQYNIGWYILCTAKRIMININPKIGLTILSIFMQPIRCELQMNSSSMAMSLIYL